MLEQIVKKYTVCETTLCGVVEGGGGGGLREAEPLLLKFHVDLGGLAEPPPTFFARCIILTTSKRQKHTQKYQ